MITTALKSDVDRDIASYIDSIASELFTIKEWENARGIDQFMGLIDSYGMVEETVRVAYERRPDIFDGINWINSDLGFPLWVREGVEWQPEKSKD